jgi:hypothetical protein
MQKASLTCVRLPSRVLLHRMTGLCADATAAEITDTGALKEQLASLLLKLGKTKEAEDAYRELLQSNSENYKYHRGLQLVSPYILSHA